MKRGTIRCAKGCDRSDSENRFCIYLGSNVWIGPDGKFFDQSPAEFEEWCRVEERYRIDGSWYKKIWIVE